MTDRRRVSSHSQGAITTQDSLHAYRSDPGESNRKFWQVKLYVIAACLLWICIGGLILYRNIQKSKALSKYDKYCCDCYKLAKESEKDKFDWSYCTDCSCSTCDYYIENNLGNLTESLTCSDIKKNYGDDYDDNDSGEICKDDHLSTTTAKFLTKDYWIYGMIAMTVAIIQIIVLLIYICTTKQIDVGIPLFIHNIVALEICYYCVFKCYQYYPFVNNDDIHCFQDVLKQGQEASLSYFVMISIAFHVLLPLTLTIFKWAVNKFNDRNEYCLSCRICWGYWNVIVSVTTIICIFWAFTIYVTITIQIGQEIDKYKADELSLILLPILIITQLIMIFLFPFCWSVSRKVIKSWHPRYCCPRSSVQMMPMVDSNSIPRPFAEFTAPLIDIDDSINGNNHKPNGNNSHHHSNGLHTIQRL